MILNCFGSKRSAALGQDRGLTGADGWGKKILPALQHLPAIYQAAGSNLVLPRHEKTHLSFLTRHPPSGTQNTDDTPVPHLEAVTGLQPCLCPAVSC